MKPAISGLYAVTSDLADTTVLLAETQATLIDAGAVAVAVISALFAVPDVEVAARKFCQLMRVKMA